MSHINHLTFPFWRSRLEKSSVRLAASAHDVQRGKAIINRTWEDHQLKAFYRFADALFVHSAYQADELVDFAGVDRSRVHVVPHGVYEHGPRPEADQTEVRRRLDLPTDRSIALFFGQIRDEKNLDALIRGLARSSSNTYLVVAGNDMGPRHRSASYYQDLARELGVNDDISFRVGYVRDDRVPELFCAADWVALPYARSFTSQSGVLNVAAHHRRPVLVTTSPVLKETVEDSEIGIVCSGADADALAAGIDRMSDLVARGHTFLFDEYHERYNWNVNADRTVEVYRSLVVEN